MSALTIQPVKYGRFVIRKDGAIVADITPSGSSGGLSVHYFGPTQSRMPMPTLVPDMDRAREVIKMVAGNG